MRVLEIRGLTKRYPAFTLDGVSFGVEAGRICGFIGRNGAGKTTTLKSTLNLVHPDSGEVRFFGEGWAGAEASIKTRTGFVSGGVDFYPQKRLRVITDVTRRFYQGWDDAAYRRYMEMFQLDESKTPAQLSAGMKVKYSLALALSHGAELLILDEPTSGLDPVSRDELLGVFLELRDRGVTILFSTHITSDLDKCADDIVYIRKGRVAADSSLEAFVSSYKVAALDEEPRADRAGPALIGVKRAKEGFTALVRADGSDSLGLPAKDADLEDIMVHLERE